VARCDRRRTATAVAAHHISSSAEEESFPAIFQLRDKIDDTRRKCRLLDAGYLIEDRKALSHTLHVFNHGLGSTI
jgi:hypothetical protein